MVLHIFFVLQKKASKIPFNTKTFLTTCLVIGSNPKKLQQFCLPSHLNHQNTTTQNSFAMASTASKTALLRKLIRELRHASSGVPSAANPRAIQYIFQQYRKYQVTDQQYCKAAEEMSHFADSYATYLESQRVWKQVHDQYHAQGERSVEETARLVGFKLPHDPK